MNNVDILAFGAHPDDVEIFMGGSLLYFNSLGLTSAICDLTKGEAGTYGSAEIRESEKNLASKRLSLGNRITLDIPDGHIAHNEANLNKIIGVVRKLKPKILFTMAPENRHPDHSYTHSLVKEASFLSGLKKWDNPLPPHRAGSLAYYPELHFEKKPDFVVDITEYIEEKKKVIEAYGSQVADTSKEFSQKDDAKTLIHSQLFWKRLEARALNAGSYIGVTYGEPFFSFQSIQLTDPINQFFKKGLH